MDSNHNQSLLFLSYHQNNEILVKPIREKLSQKFQIKIDTVSEVSACKYLNEETQIVLDSAEIVICFITKLYIESKNCLKYLEYLFEKNKKIISVLLEDLYEYESNTAVKCLKNQSILFYEYKTGKLIDLQSDFLFQNFLVEIYKVLNKKVEKISIEDKVLDIHKKAGWYTLTEACMYKETELVKLLLSKGADVNATDEKGDSPLNIACKYGVTETVKMLLAQGADVNVAQKGGTTPLNIGLNSITVKNVSLTCVSIEACKNGLTEIAKLLLSKGADVNATDEKGDSPLNIASMYRLTEIAKLLLAQGADVNVAHKGGTTPLIIASINGETELTKLLLTRGADVNVAGRDGSTPLMKACWSRNKEIVELLLNKGADVNASNNNGLTPLTIACEKANTEIIHMLLFQNILKNSTDIHEDLNIPKELTNWLSLKSELLSNDERGRLIQIISQVFNGATFDTKFYNFCKYITTEFQTRGNFIDINKFIFFNNEKLLDSLFGILKSGCYHSDLKNINTYFESFIDELVSFVMDADSNEFGIEYKNDVLKENADFRLNFEKVTFTKSIILAGLNYHLDAIHYLSKIYLLDKETYLYSYELACIILGQYKNSQYELDKKDKLINLEEEEIDLNFYMFFSKYEEAISLCKTNASLENYKDVIDDLIISANINPIKKETQQANNMNNSDNNVASNYPNDNQDEDGPSNKNNDEHSREEKNKEYTGSSDKEINSKFWILSIDGGGIKGIVPLYFLRKIEIFTGKKVYELFHLFSGTSIGGIIALLFSQRKHTAESLLHKMMGSYKNRIFSGNAVLRYIRYLYLCFTRRQRYLYDEAELEKLLKEELGNSNLSNSQGSFVITASCLMDNKNECVPGLFTRFEKDGGEIDSGFSVVSRNSENIFTKVDGFEETELFKVGRVTSAATPFFKEYKINETIFIDGGFCMNNPAQLAYKYATENNIEKKRICMLSLGCFKGSDAVNVELSIRGRQHGSVSLTNVMNINNGYVNSIMENELGNRFFRIEPNSSINSISLDGVSKENVWKMIECGESLFKDRKTKKKIENIVRLLLPPNSQRDITNLNKTYNEFIKRYQIYPEAYDEINNLINDLEITRSGNACRCNAYLCKDCRPHFDKIYPKLVWFDFNAKDETIVRPNSFLKPVCIVCKFISIGYLRGVALFKPADYLEHVCANGWTPFHFAAANDEVDSLIYLLNNKIINGNPVLGIELDDQYRVINYVINERKQLKAYLEQEFNKQTKSKLTVEQLAGRNVKKFYKIVTRCDFRIKKESSRNCNCNYL